MRSRIVVGVSAALVLGSFAYGAQQGVPVKRLLVINPPSGIRRIIYRGRSTTGVVVGDPVTNGATFNLQFTPGNTQCFRLPTSGWTPLRNGFLYRDPRRVFSPVRLATIRRRPSGVFVMRVTGSSTGISVTPPTMTYATNFRINNGDEYCSSSGSIPPRKNDSKRFLVRNDNGTACSLAACASPSGAFLDEPTVDIVG